MHTPLKVILTGTTGMVGEGVLLECLNSNLVESVLVVNRKPCGYQHPKLKEILHSDFQNIEPIAEQLKGYNTCLFCLGVSSVGMNEVDYTRLTYTLTLHFAQTLSKVQEGMTFSYISGSGTDSSEKGRLMWARVKGKTENDLQKLNFKKVYLYRPGMINPSKGQKNTLVYYKYLGWLYPLIKLLGAGTTMQQLGQSMIRTAYYQTDNKILEIKDIIKTSTLNS